MKYTKEIPTKPGHYWVGLRTSKGVIKDLVDIGYVSHRLKFYWFGTLQLADDRFEYAGPIEEPEE